VNSKGAVEAALFSASKGLKVSELAEMINVSEDRIRTSLEVLAMEYERRNSAIKISAVGNEYVMRLRDEYAPFSETLTSAELTKGMMKTLVTIAYNQPVLQSELNRNIGARVYDDVPALIEKGLISGKKVGQTLELTTTRRFIEYFGIEGSSKAAIRQWIDEMNSN